MLNFCGSLGGKASEGARTVLLLHAFPLSAAMWNAQVRSLEEAGYRVVAPHVYGVGGSDAKPGWSMDDYANDLALLLDSLECRSATILGLSMGGYQALALYRLHPEKVCSLILCDTRAEGDSPTAYAGRVEFRKAVEENGPAEAVKRMVPNFFTSQTLESKSDLVAFVTSIIEEQPAAVISDTMRAIAERPDSTALLPSISCPVLIMNGEEDTVTPPSTAAAMQAVIPGASLRIIAGASHLSNLERPVEFNTLLLEHLESL